MPSLTRKSDSFLMKLHLSNGNTVQVELSKQALTKDLIKTLLKRNGHGDCKTCKSQIHKNSLYFVNRQGQGSFADEDDGLYQYHYAECKFFWLEPSFRVITIFFPENNIESVAVHIDTKARELQNIQVFKKKLLLLGLSNVDLIYKNGRSVEEIVVSPDDQPMKFCYNKNGEQINDNGKFFFKKNAFVPADYSDEKAQLTTVKERVKRKNLVDAMGKISKKDTHIISGPDQLNYEKGNLQTAYVSTRIGDSLMRTQSVNFLDTEDNDVMTYDDVIGSQTQDLSLSELLTINENENTESEIDNGKESGLSLSFDKNADQIEQDCNPTDLQEEKLDRDLKVNEANTQNNQFIHGTSANDEIEIPVSNDNAIIENKSKETSISQQSFSASPDSTTEISNRDVTSSLLPNKSGIVIRNLNMKQNEVVSSVPEEGKPPTEYEKAFPLEAPCNTNVNNESHFNGISENAHIKSNSKHDVVSETSVNKNEPLTLRTESYEKSIQMSVKCRLCEILEIRPERITSIERLKEIRQILVATSSNDKTADERAVETNRVEHVAVEERPKETNRAELFYICLSGFHLKYSNGRWITVDDSTIGRYTGNKPPSDDSLTVNIGNGILCTYQTSSSKRHVRWVVKYATGFRQDDSDYVTVLPDNPDDDDDDDENEEGFVFSRPEKSQSFPFPVWNSMQKNFKEKLVSIKDDMKTSLIESKLISEDISIQESLKNKLVAIKDDVKLKANTTVSQPASEPVRVATDIDIVSFNTNYIKPLKLAVCLLSDEFKKMASHTADDRYCLRIGTIIRTELCDAIAALLLNGVARDDSFIRGLFTKTEQFSLWSLMKDFSKSFEREEFYCEETIIKLIDSSKFLTNQDMRFRYYICDLISRIDCNGNKLLVTWLELFSRNTPKLEKYYKINSFWRCSENEYYNMFFNENILMILKELNQWTFNLHMDFEQREKANLLPGLKKETQSSIAQEYAEVFMFE